jgi:hypothetical protein
VTTLQGHDGHRAVDGQLTLSNSEIQTWKRCRRKWYLTHYLQYGVPLQDAETGARSVGIKIHIVLDAWYAGGLPGGTPVDPVVMIGQIYDEDIERWPNAAPALSKEKDLAVAMISGYLDWLNETGADEFLKLVATEGTLEVDSPVPGVRLRGRLDQRLVRSTDGARLFLDHKAIKNGTPVLTPTGWRAIETLQVDDLVATVDGSFTPITGVYPQGEVDLFRVTFDDKTWVDTCGDHLWEVRRFSGRTEVRDTTSLVDDLKYRSPGHHEMNTWSVPVAASVQFTSRAQHLDPYVLGVWLGDGARRSFGFTTGDREIGELVEKRLIGSDVRLRHDDGTISYRIVGDGRSNSYITELRRLGLFELGSHDRFIPDDYLYGSVVQRLDLLRGMMDTDGCVRTKTKQVLYVTTSPQLRDGVAFLVRSLGGVATVTHNGQGKYVWEGVTHIKRDVYTVNIQLPASMNPFALRRKSDIFDAKVRRHRKKWMTSIEPIGRGDATCIAVAHSSALYVTKDFIVTHNTKPSIDEQATLLPLDEQMKTYSLLEYLDAMSKTGEGPPERTDGGIYNVMRRVKRTATAKPPFYGRIEVRHNMETLRSMYLRVKRVIEEIVGARAELDAGGDHRYVTYPTPDQDCSWKCPFVRMCPMMDDGSNWEGLLEEHYVHVDPYERYGDGLLEKETT